MNQIASAEHASADAATIEERTGSASFVLTSSRIRAFGGQSEAPAPGAAGRRRGHRAHRLGAGSRAGGVLVSRGSDPGASDFTLRSYIPAVCRNEWVVLLEDHALVNKRTLDAILGVIRNQPEADLVVFLGKNLTSVSRWGWAIFSMCLRWSGLRCKDRRRFLR